jgi:sugar lactone lactonase YvrE
MINLSMKRFMLVALVALNFGALTACNSNSIVAALLGPFDPAFFPIAVPGATDSFGNAAFDSNGDLIVVGGDSVDVTTVARSDGSLTALTLIGTAGQLISIVDPDTGVLYVGSNLGDIYSVDPTTGVATLVVNIGSSVNGLVVAPAGYGAFGGQLIAATLGGGGGVVAVDPTGPTVTQIVAGGYSDLEFASDGTLYTVNTGNGDVETVSAAGVVAAVATIASADGIAVDSPGGRLFVASGGAPGELFSVTIPGGVVASLGNFDLNGGFFPSGLAFDGSTLMMLTGINVMNIEAITP